LLHCHTHYVRVNSHFGNNHVTIHVHLNWFGTAFTYVRGGCNCNLQDQFCSAGSVVVSMGNLPLQDILYMSWTGCAMRVQWWCPFAIRLTIFGNLPLQDILYMFWTSFAMRVQWWCPFCHQTNHIWQFAITRHIIRPEPVF